MLMQGKVAFITGGSRGLGRAFAEALLDRGAKVSLVDINDKTGQATRKDLENKYGGNRTIFNQCDVTNLEELRGCYEKTVKNFGGLDVVINNAGILDEVNFERMIDINLTAVIRSSYMASERMRKDKGGSGGIIINVASASGIYPSAYVLAYTAVKHGVVGFSRSLAINLSDINRFGIRVAVLCPSFTRTDMMDTTGMKKVEYTRDSDVTMPVPMEAVERLNSSVMQIGIMNPKTVVDGMLELLSESKCNGAVLSVSPLGTKYIFPKKLQHKL